MIIQALRQISWQDIRIKKAWSFGRLVWRHYFGSYIQEWRLAHHYKPTLSDRSLKQALGKSGDTKTIIRTISANKSCKFFIDPKTRLAVSDFCRPNYQSAVNESIAAADTYLKHRFDLLGSGPISLGPTIPWRMDFKTNYLWPKIYYRRIQFLDIDKPVPYDVKVPWELSRFYHATTLGQAYWFTGDEKYPAEFVDQVTSWLEDNPYLYSVNWTVAMEVAIRSVNLTWGLYFMKDSPNLTDKFLVMVYKSILQHGRFIMNNLEYNKIASNHYLSDGVGLVFLGILYPEFTEAKEWLAKGMEILTGEMPKQILPDGVDYEMSIPYHRLVTELYLSAFLLCRLNNVQIDSEYWERLQKMLVFIDSYTKPDGLAPVIGDADDGRLQILSEATRRTINDHRYLTAVGSVLFPTDGFKHETAILPFESFWLLGVEEWETYQNLQTQPARHSLSFPDGGFYILRHDKFYCFFDAGGVGLRDRGGHGHNDVLSFVLNWHGYDIIVDRGSYVYTAMPKERNLFRGTAAHNTAQLDRQEINDFPDDIFALPEQANPQVLQWVAGPKQIICQAKHFGYQKLVDPVIHQRLIQFDSVTSELLIKDQFIGSGEHSILLSFHLAPDCRVIRKDQAHWQIAHPNLPNNLEMSCESSGAYEFDVRPSDISPSYGVKIPSNVINLTSTGLLPINFITKIKFPVDKGLQ